VKVIQNNIIFICLPTPMNPDGSCNTSIVEGEIEKLDKLGNYTIIVKSTIIPGTTKAWNQKYQSDIVFNPEFLTEKNAVKDFENQKHIVLGGPENATEKIKKKFKVVFEKAKISCVEETAAELLKYYLNTFLAVKVSFANEMFQLSQKLGVNYNNLLSMVLEDERIGKTHLKVPGHDGDFGYGGHCFPKDTNALIKLTEELVTVNHILKATELTNSVVRKYKDWEKMKGRSVL
jgi:UDPglucose 6-dehydrogenase